MNDNAKIGMAITGGYLLGRTKKGKAALTVALWLAAGRLDKRPSQIASEAVSRLAAVPQVAELGAQLRGPMAAAGRQAALATVESRMDRLAERLHERTSGSVVGDSANDGSAEDKAQTRKSETTGAKASKRKSGKRTSSNREPARARR